MNRMAKGRNDTISRTADAVRAGLRAAARPEKADGMRAYLKSALPCLGTYSDDRRRAVDQALAGITVELDRPMWEELIRALWDDPEHREERQAAVDVLVHRRARHLRDVDALPLCRALVVEGAWWDLVDGIGKAVNEVLDRHRVDATPIIRAWATDDDMWVRRSAIISQLRSRGATDLELFGHAVDANIDDEDFFVRKAIGWALRSHARTDPDWVRDFVRDRRDRLSALSIREATKHL